MYGYEITINFIWFVFALFNIFTCKFSEEEEEETRIGEKFIFIIIILPILFI